MKRRHKIAVAVIFALGLACAVPAFWGGDDDGLFLYCGAGLRPAVEDICAEFTATTGIPVNVTYAGSGCLLSMLTFARSGDLYMPGERYYAAQAAAAGHLEDETIVGHFVAVVMVRQGNPKGIRTFRDLARPDVRVGIGEPASVACGLAARRILEQEGVWDEVKANIDRNGALVGNAIELSNAVVLNALDAVINWDAMAYLVRDQVDILVIPQDRNTDVEIPLGVLTWSTRKRAAARFVALVTSPEGRKHFESHGYHTSMEPYMLPYYGSDFIE